ncbi:hypothetical protein EV378_6781 [Pseudonocardia endophytica]|uniref:Uncharacterized protein n=1 Tax=Pseudonocardia endophytica TaxID=401976 RepID=A0A4R1HYW4_PSEEN|nr:hypothetical protein EV378_6781 [Pseudonocardia endophytica]
MVPRECTSIELGKLYCSAREPVAFLGTGGDFRSTGMRGQTVDNFRDVDGRSFQWIISAAGEPVSVTSRLMCNDDGRVLTVSQNEIETLIGVGDDLPPTLLAKIGSEGSTDAATSQTSTPATGVPETAVGGGDPRECRAELERLLRDVVSGRLSGDEAEARIPDAAGTVALRTAVDAVGRYRGDGLTEDESVAEAGGAFTYPCGER